MQIIYKNYAHLEIHTHAYTILNPLKFHARILYKIPYLKSVYFIKNDASVNTS